MTGTYQSLSYVFLRKYQPGELALPKGSPRRRWGELPRKSSPSTHLKEVGERVPGNHPHVTDQPPDLSPRSWLYSGTWARFCSSCSRRECKGGPPGRQWFRGRQQTKTQSSNLAKPRQASNEGAPRSIRIREGDFPGWHGSPHLWPLPHPLGSLSECRHIDSTAAAPPQCHSVHNHPTAVVGGEVKNQTETVAFSWAVSRWAQTWLSQLF